MGRFFFMLCWVAAPAFAQVTTTFRNGEGGYTGLRDVAIIGDSGEPWDPNTNYEGSGDFIDGAPTEEAVLMRFDVSTIPTTAIVTSATLALHLGDGTNASYSIYAVNLPWVASQATWNRATNAIPWQGAGATGALDRSSTSGGTVTGAGAVTVTLNATGRNMVQTWVASASANFGFIIQNYAAVDGTDVSDCSAPVLTERPQLTVVTSLGTFVFRNGASPMPSYQGCVDVSIGDGLDPVVTNWNGTSAFEVDSQKTILMSVDLGAIPPWATVTGAALEVRPVTTSTSTYETFELLRAWSETQATWLEASSGVPWQQAGAAGAADHDTLTLATWSSPGASNARLTFNDAGVEAVQRWVRTPASNFGFALQNFAATSAFRFDESEDPTVSSRPRFEVTWFEGRLVFAPASGLTDVPFTVDLQRQRFDGVEIAAGAPELQVQLTANADTQLSTDGGAWSSTVTLTIPAEAARSSFLALRSTPGLASLAATAGPAWADGMTALEVRDAGAVEEDAGMQEPPDAGARAPMALLVGCGCSSGGSPWLLLMTLFLASRPRPTSRLRGAPRTPRREARCTPRG